MSQAKPRFIKIPVAADEQQTMPVDPEKRLRDSEIRIEPCVEQDAEKIVSHGDCVKYAHALTK
jgi:hypothetical protein